MAGTDYHGKYKKLFPGILSSNSFLTVYTLHLLDGTTRMYGKEIADGITNRLNNTWKPSHGLIYPLLRKMEELELIVGAWEGNSNKKTRRFYFITDKGRQALADEKKKIHDQFLRSRNMIDSVMNDLYEGAVV